MKSLFDDMNMVTDLERADSRVRDTVDALAKLTGMTVIAMYRMRTEKVPAPTRKDANATRTEIITPKEYAIRVITPTGIALGDSTLTLDSQFGALVCGGGSGLFMGNTFGARWNPIRKRLEEEFGTVAYQERNKISG